MSAIMQINQAGLSAGTPGVSRLDGLATGALITVISTDFGASHQLYLRSAPTADTTALDSFTQTSTSPPTWTFSPTAGVYGTYLLELIVDGQRQRRLIRIATPAGLHISALGERGSPSASLQNSGAEYIDASDDNEGDNYTGWHRRMEQNLLLISAGLGGGGDGDGMSISSVQATGFAAAVNTIYRINQAALPFTATLPTGMPVGTRVGFIFQDAFAIPTGALTINRNGNTVNGVAFNPSVARLIQNGPIMLRWTGATWQTVSSMADYLFATTPLNAPEGMLIRGLSSGIPYVGMVPANILKVNTTVRAANFTAVANEINIINQAALPFDFDLPASPAAGQMCGIYLTGNAPTNTDALTVNRNGSTIEGVATGVTLYGSTNSPQGGLMLLRYTGTTWRVESSYSDWTMMKGGAYPAFTQRAVDGTFQLTPAQYDNTVFGRQSAGDYINPIEVPANTIFGNCDRLGMAGTPGMMAALVPMDIAKVTASMVHWSAANVSGGFTAEPNRGYHCVPGGGGQIVDMSNVADTPDGAEVTIFKNSNNANAINIFPGDATGFVAAGALVASFSYSTAYTPVRLKFSAHLDRWIISASA